MLEAELNKERDALKLQIEELREKAEELKSKEDRLRHVEALLGIDGSVAEDADARAESRSSRINWADCCRAEGLWVGGDSGHRVLRRLKPDVHTTIPHVCVIDMRTYE